MLQNEEKNTYKYFLRIKLITEKTVKKQFILHNSSLKRCEERFERRIIREITQRDKLS